MTVKVVPALAKIQCDIAPTDNADLANKKYVDDAVASASGGGASDHLTTDTQGVYAYAPLGIGVSTYLVPQTVIATEYDPATTYQIGDICTYQGELWKRQLMSGSGTTPSSTGMLWQKVDLSSMLAGGGGSADKATATVNGGNGAVDMTGNPEVIIDNSPFFIGTIGLILSNLSITGMLCVEVHITYASAGTRSSFKVNAGSGAQEVVWVRGGLSDLSSAGTHIVRLRKFAATGSVYAEYIGVYTGESPDGGTVVIPLP